MRSLGASLGATRANNFPRQADESEQAAGDQASWRTGSDNLERLTGIYGLEGLHNDWKVQESWLGSAQGWALREEDKRGSDVLDIRVAY